MSVNILQALAPGLDIDLNTWKVEAVDVGLPPLAVDQVSEGGEYPATTQPVNDALQANYSALDPSPARDLVVLSATLGDQDAPLALGLRKGGDLVAAAPSSAVLKIVEFVGEKPLSLNAGTVAAMADAEGVRYRLMLDLTANKLRSLVEGRMKARTAFLDAKAQLSLVVPATVAGASVTGASTTWDMVHNQSTAKDVALDLPDHAVGTTVSYDVVVVVNVPASDYLYRYATLTTTVDVTRAAGGAFTAAAVTGASSATGEVYPEVAGDQRTYSDYKHTLSVVAATNGSTGITLQCTVDTEDYSNVRKITVPWSSGVTLDASGKLSARQDLDVWYNSGDSGNSTALLANTKPWSSLSLIEADFYTATAVFGDPDVDFALFGRESAMDLILRPANLATDFTADFDKFAVKLQQTAASNYAATNHNGGTYAGCTLSAVATEPAPSGYGGVTIRKSTQPFIMRIFRGLD